MKKNLRFGVTALAVMFVFGLFAATETKAQLQDILNTMDNHNKLLKSLQANVTMGKYNSQLEVNDITEGTVKYLPGSEKNMYVRIDWTKPVVESLAVANGQYVLYTPRRQQAILGKVDKAQGSAKANGALAFMSMSKTELKKNYNVKYLGKETAGGVMTWHLELTPKAAGSYKQADLWVDGNGMPIQAKVTERNNDTTTVLLSNLQKNITIDARVFQIELPKTTKKILG